MWSRSWSVGWICERNWNPFWKQVVKSSENKKTAFKPAQIKNNIRISFKVASACLRKDVSGFSVFLSDAPQPALLTKLTVAMATTDDNDTTQRRQLVATRHGALLSTFIILSHPKILDMYSKLLEPNSSGPIEVISVLGRKKRTGIPRQSQLFWSTGGFFPSAERGQSEGPRRWMTAHVLLPCLLCSASSASNPSCHRLPTAGSARNPAVKPPAL